MSSQQPVTAANEQSATAVEEQSATAVAASVVMSSHTPVPDDLLRRLCYWPDHQGHKWTIRTGPGEVNPMTPMVFHGPGNH